MSFAGPFGRRWCCSLRIAASVVSVYITVAYAIAFLMELWWVWDTGGNLPYLAYILIAGYFVTFVLSTILVKGISDKQIPHLVLWMFGIVAIIIPEGGIVLFMSFQFWKIHTIYGLTEITCWACRLLVDVVGLLCVYFLYINWREEKQVLTSLRDLNMASTPTIVENARRSSVVSMGSDKSAQRMTYANPGFTQIYENRIPPPNFRRSGSLMSLGHPPRVKTPPFSNEFNASLFNTRMRKSPQCRSMQNLTSVGQTTREEPLAPTQLFVEQPLRRYASLGFFPSGGDDRMRNGYFAVPSSGYVVNSRGKVSLVKEPVINSRTSMESDELHKYRDVAL